MRIMIRKKQYRLVSFINYINDYEIITYELVSKYKISIKPSEEFALYELEKSNHEGRIEIKLILPVTDEIYVFVFDVDHDEAAVIYVGYYKKE